MEHTLLKDHEKVIEVVRKHRSAVIQPIVLWTLIASASVYAVARFPQYFFGYDGYVILGVLAVSLSVILYKIFIWRKSKVVITSQRIIIKEQENLFSKTSTELLLRDIAEVGYRQGGVSATMYRFGELFFKTAANSKIVFDKVAKPDAVVEIINHTRFHANKQ